jgi:hypothetical protein
MKTAAGLDENLFSEIVSNTRQGAPWLKKTQDGVVVIVPGRTSALPATAEELAMGRFYLSLAEYEADRPAGVPYAAVAKEAA